MEALFSNESRYRELQRRIGSHLAPLTSGQCPEIRLLSRKSASRYFSFAALVDNDDDGISITFQQFHAFFCGDNSVDVADIFFVIAVQHDSDDVNGVKR
jgi:hypothetical protein